MPRRSQMRIASDGKRPPGSRHEAQAPGLDTGAAGVLAARMSDKLLTYAAERGLKIPPPPHTADVLGELAASVYLHPVRTTRKMPREMAYLQTARQCELRTSSGILAAWQWGAAG